jgi:hypothetical protein
MLVRCSSRTKTHGSEVASSAQRRRLIPLGVAAAAAVSSLSERAGDQLLGAALSSAPHRRTLAAALDLRDSVLRLQ